MRLKSLFIYCGAPVDPGVIGAEPLYAAASRQISCNEKDDSRHRRPVRVVERFVVVCKSLFFLGPGDDGHRLHTVSCADGGARVFGDDVGNSLITAFVLGEAVSGPRADSDAHDSAVGIHVFM